jgi:parallel beta-helix repeat protein
MKKLLSVFLLLFRFSYATTYYVSNSGNDAANGISASTPFATFSKANSVVAPGDIVRFKKGDTFYGNNSITKSGTAANPIVWDAYGVGANPVFTGFMSVEGWKNEGGGMYSFVDGALPAVVNVVTVNGIPVGRGRWPKKGYRTYTGHVTNTSITDPLLPDNPSFIGAELVVRKNQFITDRRTITGQSAGVISYSGGGYNAVDNFGYFIQNHPSVCTSLGDWCYDVKAKKLYMFFGNASPSDFKVQVSMADRNITMSNTRYHTFKNLDFEGANLQNVIGQPVSNIAFENCNFRLAGQYAIWYLEGSTNVTIDKCSFADMMNNGIQGISGSKDWSITNNKFERIFQINGANMSGDGMGNAIYVDGDNTMIDGNIIKNVGFNGIYFKGNNVTVQHNFIDTFCNLKQDGGGIYTYSEGQKTFIPRSIQDNIILNGIGAVDGLAHLNYALTDQGAYGIYLDDFTSQVEVKNNTIANCSRAGIFIHNGHDITLANNILFHNYSGIYYERGTLKGALIRTVNTTGNTIVAGAGQSIAECIVVAGNSPGEASLLGNFNNNTYITTADAIANSAFILNYKRTTFKEWQRVVSSDASSTVIHNTSNSILLFNEKPLNKHISLADSYFDLNGLQYRGAFTLPSFKSLVLFKTPSLKSPRHS